MEEKKNMYEGNECLEMLDAAMDCFKDDRSASFGMCVSAILARMLAEDAKVIVPAVLSYEDLKSVQLARLYNENGNFVYLMQTHECDSYDMSVEISAAKLFSMVYQEDNCDGILINAFEGNAFLVVYPLVESLFVLACNGFGEEEHDGDEDEDDDEEDDEEEDEGSETQCGGGEGLVMELECSRPDTKTEFDGVMTLVETLEYGDGNSVVIHFSNYVHDDTIDFCRIHRTENGYHMELELNMEEFDWDEPLILGCDDIKLERVKDLLEGIIVDGKTSGESKFIYNNFRKL